MRTYFCWDVFDNVERSGFERVGEQELNEHKEMA